ncbi:hypothetical protein GGI07_003576 [Coemansia sp. Benny D115]|nr:hypothetical protein GGI07_003576 [Coemansia sp. Benny D115]
MGADSKHLSWVLQRLSREARAQVTLRHSAQNAILGALSRLLLSRSAMLSAPKASQPRLPEGAGKPTRGWQERRAKQQQQQQQQQDRQKPQRKGQLLGCDAAGPAYTRSKNGRRVQGPPSTQPGSKERAAAAVPVPVPEVDVRIRGRLLAARSVVGAQRRRWMAWRSASGWDFPTLNASFPFTIPSIPAGLFLFAQQQSAHTSMPSGVMMPAGLGTSARKFHSISLTRQPGVPLDGDEDAGSGGNSSPPFTDPAALSAQVGRPDAAARAKASLQHGKPLPPSLSRRTDASGGGMRSRTAKNYMFAHAATGIPKFDNRIPLAKKSGGSKATSKALAALVDDTEEMATSAGEDAFFHRSDALGIADGVGGWAGVKDADPSLFARRLMHHVCLEVQRYEDIDDEMFSHYYDAAPVDILRRAYEITLDEMEALAMRGSSTACVVVLRGDELRVANLGDCGLTVVRQGDMVYRTEEQQHSFNFPYQLGTEAHSDGPSDAQVFRLKIQRGDIIIVGSDGVFDNLFDEDILEEVNQHLPPIMRAEGEPELKYSNDSLWYESQQSSNKLEALCSSVQGDGSVATSFSAPNVVAAPSKFSLPQFHIDPKAISLAIAKRARLVSENTTYSESPFQMRAMQEGLYYQGGKRDDITVVVAVVTDLEDTPDRR